MENTKVDWKTFIARRKINLREWATINKIKSFLDIQNWCNKNGLTTPSESSVSFLFTSDLPTKQTEEIKPEEKEEILPAEEIKLKVKKPRKKKTLEKGEE